MKDRWDELDRFLIDWADEVIQDLVASFSGDPGRLQPRRSSPDDDVCTASSFGGAGSRRCFSRSLMSSSYFAVPGRGGASAGKPPSQTGT